MTDLARLQDAIPVVATSAARASMFPVPNVGQRVWNEETASVEEYDGASWVPWFTRPTLSTDRGDANVTLVAGTDDPVQRFATTLTANRTVTLGAGYNGAAFRVVRTGLGAFTLDVGGLKTIPSATAAFVDVAHDGTAWRLTGYGAL